MKKLTTFSILILISFLTACGSGGGGGGGGGDPAALPPSDNGGDPAPSPPAQPVLENTVIFYIATSSSSSQYFHDYDITLDASTQHIIRYLPSQNRAEVVERNYSPSYAKSTVVPYTVDDRYFVRAEWRGHEPGGYHDMKEYDPLSGNQILTFRVQDPYSSNGCSAVVGNSYYFSESRTWDILRGYSGGEFKRVTFSNITYSSPQTLLAYGDPDSCIGNLTSNKGKLYDAYYIAGIVRLYVRDLETGRIVTRREFAVTSPSLYDANSYQFTFDDNTAYFVRKSNGGRIELWSYRIADLASSAATLLFSTTIANFNTNYMDADNGRIAIGSYSGKILLFDTSSRSESIYDLGIDFYAMQILFIQR